MKTILAIASLLFLVTAAWASPPHGIEVRDAWVREAPPMAKVLAAYLQLHNHADETRTLVGVESAAFQRVELHRSRQQDGVASMAPAAKIVIAAHGKIAFQPGGLHIMLIGPVTRLKAGDTVPLELRFADGRSVSISAEVRRGRGKAHHRGMDMKSHQH